MSSKTAVLMEMALDETLALNVDDLDAERIALRLWPGTFVVLRRSVFSKEKFVATELVSGNCPMRTRPAFVQGVLRPSSSDPLFFREAHFSDAPPSLSAEAEKLVRR